MYQLKYDNLFTNIIEDKSHLLWKNMDDVSVDVMDFINSKSDSRVIYVEKEDKYYCSKCLKELSNFKCPNCEKEIDKDNVLKVSNLEVLDEEYFFYSYYVFDIVDREVIVYKIKENVRYRDAILPIRYRYREYKISEVYAINKNKIVDINENKECFYKDFYTYDDNDTFLDFIDNGYYSYLYVGNLEQLKYVDIYKYSFIWLGKEYLKKRNDISLLDITYSVLYYRQFEYLIKLGFYNLAFSCNCSWIEDESKDILGVPRGYYEFMRSIDITVSQLEVLKIVRSCDIDIINFYEDYLYLLYEHEDYKYFGMLKEYFEENGYKNERLVEYFDYLSLAEKCGLDMKDKKVLFPRDLEKAHDKLSEEYILIENPEIDKKIKSVSNILSLNSYEDDKYVIFPVQSINGLVDESSQMHNCVRSYYDRVADVKSEVYFMREKNNIDKSFVTVEVRKGKVVQARSKYNGDVSDEVWKVLKKWEKSLVLIDEEE